MKPVPVAKQIPEAAKQLKAVMQDRLGEMTDDLIARIMARVKAGKSAKGLDPEGVEEYTEDMREAFAILAMDAMDLAKLEIPKATKRLYDCSEGAVQLADFNRLPKDLQAKINKRLALLVGIQTTDLKKLLDFALNQVKDSDSPEEIRAALDASAIGWLDGVAMESGAQLNAASVINDARSAYFFDPDVLEEIEAFEFVNGDPVTPICQDLDGKVFEKDDPNLLKYTPPLHWNCKSSIQPILKGQMKGRETEKLKPSDPKLNQYVVFTENRACMDF